jgi:hypothetical protein
MEEQGLNRLRKNPFERRSGVDSVAGAKSPRSFFGAYGPAEAVPLLQNLFCANFSAACEAQAFLTCRFGMTEVMP